MIRNGDDSLTVASTEFQESASDLQTKDHFKRNKLSGQYTAIDPFTGQVTEQGEFRNGLEVGVWKTYDEDGDQQHFRFETVRIGARCRDGSFSEATGRGACSWHGGVEQWLHGTQKTKIGGTGKYEPIQARLQKVKEKVYQKFHFQSYGDEFNYEVMRSLLKKDEQLQKAKADYSSQKEENETNKLNLLENKDQIQIKRLEEQLEKANTQNQKLRQQLEALKDQHCKKEQKDSHLVETIMSKAKDLILKGLKSSEAEEDGKKPRLLENAGEKIGQQSQQQRQSDQSYCSFEQQEQNQKEKEQSGRSQSDHTSEANEEENLTDEPSQENLSDCEVEDQNSSLHFDRQAPKGHGVSSKDNLEASNVSKLSDASDKFYSICAKPTQEQKQDELFTGISNENSGKQVCKSGLHGNSKQDLIEAKYPSLFSDRCLDNDGKEQQKILLQELSLKAKADLFSGKTGTTLFGNSANQEQASNNLFSGKTGTTLFGNSANQEQASNNLFSGKTGTTLFGNSANQEQASNNLFSGKTGTTLFGNSANQEQQSLFK